MTATTIRISNETKNKLASLSDAINAKELGRKLNANEIIFHALNKLNNEDVEALQASSLSNADLLEKAFKEHCLRFGEISKDTFLGILLRGERGNS